MTVAKHERRLSIRNHKPLPVPRRYKRLPAKMSDRAEVTVVVRSKGSEVEWRQLVTQAMSAPLQERKYLTRAAFGKAWGASPEDLAKISAYGNVYGLKTVASDSWRRCVVLSGTLNRLQKAFGVELILIQHPERNFLTYRGAPKVDASIYPMVEAILGLDTRPSAHPHMTVTPFNAPPELNLPDLRKIYAFPRKARGKGQCVAVIELGGGFRKSDYIEYFKRICVTPPRLRVETLPGAANNPASAADIRVAVRAAAESESPPETLDSLNVLWTCETAMDLQIVGTLAPEAKLRLIFGIDDDQGRYHAITSVLADAHNKPSVISCSWSDPESTQTPAAMSVLDSWFQAAAVLGVTMCYSSGDAGDGTLEETGEDLTFTANFPASSPHVLACGGTTLDVKKGAEVAWRQELSSTVTMAGGGGFSAVFVPRPEWQICAGIDSADWIPADGHSGTGRGIPDVSAKANFDPKFSYITGGVESATGGTSAAAPLWAALIAVLNEALGFSLGSINALLYDTALHKSLRDITEGNTGHLCARPGWDPSTGWGSPHGQAMLKALAGRG
ncbi:MAG: kumamolisin [Thermoanaerobaculia bacterium]|jgi:kumamolisin|nr:kumamolisin [Thermoanaerobaculia bacterium]